MKNFSKYLIALALVFSSFNLVNGTNQASAAATFIAPSSAPINGDYMDEDYDFGDHYGIDYDGNYYDPVYASGAGTVTKVNSGCSNAGDSNCGSGWGNYIEITHNVNGENYLTRYAHLSPGTATVTVGQSVSQGYKIGEMGNSGFSYGAHLHFEFLVNGIRVNPHYYLNEDLEGDVTPEPILHEFDGSWATLRTESPQGNATVNTFASPGVGLNGTLPTGSLYKVYEKSSRNGVDYFRVATDTWVHRDNGEVKPYMVKASYSTTTYEEPAVNPVRHSEGGLAPGDSYKAYGTEVTADGQQWYNLGGMGWIKADANGLQTYRMP
ncbi:M23 family metallopeptidase [Jeotgalibacillus salarius]|uniref:M23 family metallopeptidase n=1 Tax=Jeotgalibacillus salarius TaxID=546023 RepID=A0A4Y8LM85_9BACL|nr:M23 family metallopeptidase [Jeotgalibacillus salarius]TFE04056.1 M23 family metallopeptidase [Jeotgalibacillus salarius]